jgi:hypothetical protein
MEDALRWRADSASPSDAVGLEATAVAITADGARKRIG